MAKVTVPEDTASEQEALAAVSINEADIQGEYIRQSTCRYRFGGLLARARRAAKAAKYTLEAFEGELYMRFKPEGGEKGGLTVDQVKSKVSMAMVNCPAMTALLDAELLRDELDAIVVAIDTKKDMLVSLGADLRAQRDPQINDRKR